jgi:hypothetical protein
MKYRANVTNLWLEVPKGPPQPGHRAAITADIRGKRTDQVRVEFDPEEAAAIGRRLLDWAARADVVAAVNAVGGVMWERNRG